jgi:hypothetical protein
MLRVYQDGTEKLFLLVEEVTVNVVYTLCTRVTH